MGNVLDAVSPAHRPVIEDELARCDPTLLAELLSANEPTPEQRKAVNQLLAIAVINSLGPDYTPDKHGLAVERAVEAFLEAWPIYR